MNDPYDIDVYAWSQRQAALLRELASRSNPSNELDWDHLAEEIEDVGKSELSAVKSFLRQFLIHVIKAAFSPRESLVPDWVDEALRFHGDAFDRLTPSMKNAIDLDTIWIRAVREAQQSLASYEERLPQHLPTGCPFNLDDLTGPSIDIREAIARVIQAAREAGPLG